MTMFANPTIDRAHLRALLAADARRLGPIVGRSTAGVLAVLVLALATGAGETGFVVGLVCGLLFMQPTFLAIQLVKDRVDGTLTFLCALPVTPQTLAAVRFVPIVALSVVGGVLATVLATQSGMPARLGGHPAVATAGLLVVATLLPVGSAALVLALSARFKFETLISLPVMLIFGGTALAKIAERFAPAGTGARLLALLAQPWLPAVALATLAALLVAVVVVGFRVTARTFERFTPEARQG